MSKGKKTTGRCNVDAGVTKYTRTGRKITCTQIKMWKTEDDKVYRGQTRDTKPKKRTKYETEEARKAARKASRKNYAKKVTTHACSSDSYDNKRQARTKRGKVLMCARWGDGNYYWSRDGQKKFKSAVKPKLEN